MEILNIVSSNTTAKHDFVMRPPAIGARITFNTPDDGLLAGFVSAFRPNLGNGEIFAWVELDHQWPGMFRGVPLADIESADKFGHDRRRSLVTSEGGFHKMYLCNFSNQAQAATEQERGRSF